MRRRSLLLAASGTWALAPAHARIPDALAPLRLVADGQPDKRIFDLTPALARASSEKKRLYLYLGADDCTFCKRYEAFLQKNASQLAPHFAKDYVVAELRSNLSVQAKQLFFKTGGQTLAYADFQKAIGDERARLLVYPCVWVLDAKGKPLMQMPAGAGTFETVDEQLEILNLVQ